MSYVRTPEHRALRAELIRSWRPWERSTGPKTPAGKEKAAKRGFQGGTRLEMRAIGRALRAQKSALDAQAATM